MNEIRELMSFKIFRNQIIDNLQTFEVIFIFNQKN